MLCSWGERYELYRWYRAYGTWTYLRGVTQLEIYNEPELDSSCINEQVRVIL